MFALVGSVFFVATLLTQTMVPLRVANMIGCTFFVGFGALAGDIKTFLLYLLLLPINAVRLRQMLNLVKKARAATQGDMSMEWLKPFMSERKYREGDILFRKDDAATEMFLTLPENSWSPRSTSSFRRDALWANLVSYRPTTGGRRRSNAPRMAMS